MRIHRSILLWLIPVCHGWSPLAHSLKPTLGRREAFGHVIASIGALVTATSPAGAEEGTPVATLPQVEVVASGDAKQLFNEGRVLEMQGNMAAAQRLYAKVTKISPRFIYGWSNLGNTQVVFGDLNPAEESYNKAISLCEESIQTAEKGFGVRKCDDLYVLLLNRGCLRMNNGREKEALQDLSKASVLRGRPDAVVAQNLARARELNGQFDLADREYDLAISMTSNEVNPFWLRSALVKLQLGDLKSGFDLMKRVENRFPEAPEVKAAYSTFLAAQGDLVAAQQKYLTIPNRPRANYVDRDYLTKTVAWPPQAIDLLSKVTEAAGDFPVTN